MAAVSAALSALSEAELSGLEGPLDSSRLFRRDLFHREPPSGPAADRD